MRGAPFVRLFCATDEAVLCVPRPRALAKGGDLGALAEQFLAPGVVADQIGSMVEVGGFGIGTENVAEEEVCHAALGASASVSA